jgi:hypothetical protein
MVFRATSFRKCVSYLHLSEGFMKKDSIDLILIKSSIFLHERLNKGPRPSRNDPVTASGGSGRRHPFTKSKSCYSRSSVFI